MENYCYSVEIFEHHVGICEYKLFSSWLSGVDYAKGYMKRMDGIEDYKVKDSTEDDVVRLFEGEGESVIIRRKDLLS